MSKALSEILDPEHLPPANIRAIAAGVVRECERIDRKAKNPRDRKQALEELAEVEHWIQTQWLKIPEGRRLRALGLERGDG